MNELLSLLLASTVISSIISGFITYFNSRHSEKLTYSEKAYQEQYKSIKESIQAITQIDNNMIDLKTQLTTLERILNPYGKYRYLNKARSSPKRFIFICNIFILIMNTTQQMFQNILSSLRRINTKHSNGQESEKNKLGNSAKGISNENQENSSQHTTMFYLEDGHIFKIIKKIIDDINSDGKYDSQDKEKLIAYLEVFNKHNEEKYKEAISPSYLYQWTLAIILNAIAIIGIATGLSTQLSESFVEIIPYCVIFCVSALPPIYIARNSSSKSGRVLMVVLFTLIFGFCLLYANYNDTPQFIIYGLLLAVSFIAAVSARNNQLKTDNEYIKVVKNIEDYWKEE